MNPPTQQYYVDDKDQELRGAGRHSRKRGRGKVKDALRKGWTAVKQFAKDQKLGSKLVSMTGDALKSVAPEWAPAIGAVQDKVGDYVSRKGYGYNLAGAKAKGYGYNLAGGRRKLYRPLNNELGEIAPSVKRMTKAKRKKTRELAQSKKARSSCNPKVGTMRQVYTGEAERTAGGLTFDKLTVNKRGKVVSKKRSENGHRNIAFLRNHGHMKKS